MCRVSRLTLDLVGLLQLYSFASGQVKRFALSVHSFPYREEHASGHVDSGSALKAGFGFLKHQPESENESEG